MGAIIKFLIGLWLAITAVKFFFGLRKVKGDKPLSDASVVEAEKCPVCGVFGDQPCRNCNRL